MAEAGLDGVLRRKIATAKAVQSIGGPGADRSWRQALARAANEELGLALDVTGLKMQTQSLSEVMELPFVGGLIAVLQGPAEGTGLMLLTPEVVAALIEMQTLGKVGTQPLELRKPTRTDAAMVAPMLDAALIALEKDLAQEADLVWAGGFRYASFLDDPRPLNLLMEDIGYRMLTAELSLGLGARKGRLYLALPAKGRGPMPTFTAKPAVDETAAALGFAQALAEQVQAAGCVLDAVLGRVALPLHQVMSLEVGALVPLGRATLDQLRLSTVSGAPLAQGKLGQHRGMRAIRLSIAEQGGAQGLRARFEANAGTAMGQASPLTRMDQQGFAASPLTPSQQANPPPGLPLAQAG